jgi:hypothetical protein
MRTRTDYMNLARIVMRFLHRQEISIVTCVLENDRPKENMCNHQTNSAIPPTEVNNLFFFWIHQKIV